MKIGSKIYVGPAKLAATFGGYTAGGLVKAVVNGEHRCLPPEKVMSKIRKKKWEIGSACTVEIYDVPGKPLAAEVVSKLPLKVRITAPDHLWFGCVVSDRDGKIRGAA